MNNNIVVIFFCLSVVWLIAINWLVGFWYEPMNIAAIHIETIPIDKPSLIQFNQLSDCPFAYISNLIIRFNVDSHSNGSIAFTFFEEIHDGNFFKLISSCNALIGGSCKLEVPTDSETKYLVAQTEKMRTSTDKGKFYWECKVNYSFLILGLVAILAGIMNLYTSMLIMVGFISFHEIAK